MRKTFKKSLLVMLAFMPGAAFAAPADSDGNTVFTRPYIGADYDHMMIDYNDIPGTGGISYDRALEDNLHGGNVHIGARFHKNFGLEAGYMMTAEGEESNVLGTGFNSKLDVQGPFVDAMVYLPISATQNRLELIGTIGASWFKAEVENPAVGSYDEREWNGRVGGGAQFWVTDNINVRGLARYQGADFDDVADDAVILSAGLNFAF